jgi:hypothetical protein
MTEVLGCRKFAVAGGDGGHFAAFEEPQLLAEDLRAFFRPLRAS